jgi:hypothetical protein
MKQSDLKAHRNVTSLKLVYGDSSKITSKKTSKDIKKRSATPIEEDD